MSPPNPFPSTNRLLDRFPAQEQEALRPHLEPIRLATGQPLYDANKPVEYVWFPHRGVVSLVSDMAEATVEIATVGDEGLVGVSVLLDADVMAHRAFVQVPGEGVRVEASVFRDQLVHSHRTRRLCSRYVLALFGQIAQNAACNRTHTVGQRCARWLLMTHDRMHQRSFPLTQDFLAQMLGVRRPTVSIAAGMLQRAGWIGYVRGVITILDREGLESAACECYGIITTQFDRLLGEH